ncbi:MAG: carboxypeptidase-like regulatory domain-containing protein, partial [Bryobacteraceae bacterium]|nr:carboxypeptidase-like regulatory domain-containing protein [Bryobacteraceae bacterium]
MSLSIMAWAQTTSTSILGSVSDSSGSVMSGAKVTLTNVRTGVKAETTTTSSGDFVFPLIDVGEYEVSVEMSGFKSETRKGVLVQINEKVRVDFNLSVGQVTERIEVSAAATQLKTDEVSLGTAVEQRRLVELPVNGRNVGNLATLQAGVMFGPRGGLDGQGGGGGGIPIPGQTIAIVANGQREVNQHATLDGVVATEARVNTVPFSPSPEAMEEVKVLTGSYSAEYGFNSGAQLVMVMRSGGNDFHGSVYNFLRNDKLDAEDYFQNYFRGPTTPRSPKQQIRQNQFGAVLSGPVWIPKLYNGKNRTFFMFNYEGR